MTPGRAMLSAPVARRHSRARCDSRSVPMVDGTRGPARRPPGRPRCSRHPGRWRRSPTRRRRRPPRGARARSFRRAAGSRRSGAAHPRGGVQFLRVGVQHHHPPLAGELAGEFPAGLPRPHDDDPGKVVRRRRFVFRGGFRAAFRHGGGETETRADSGPEAVAPRGDRSLDPRSGLKRSRERTLLRPERPGDLGHRVGVPGRVHHPTDGLLGVRRSVRTGFLGTHRPPCRVRRPRTPASYTSAADR